MKKNLTLSRILSDSKVLIEFLKVCLNERNELSQVLQKMFKNNCASKKDESKQRIEINKFLLLFDRLKNDNFVGILLKNKNSPGKIYGDDKKMLKIFEFTQELIKDESFKYNTELLPNCFRKKQSINNKKAENNDKNMNSVIEVDSTRLSESIQNESSNVVFSVQLSSLNNGLLTSLVNNNDFTEKVENFCLLKINEIFKKTEEDFKKILSNLDRSNMENKNSENFNAKSPVIENICSPISSNLQYLHQNILQKKKDRAVQEFIYKQFEKPPHTPRNPN